MICIKADIPDEICKINDELKAIYHSSDTVCIWVFKSMEDLNKFMQETSAVWQKMKLIKYFAKIHRFFFLNKPTFYFL